MLYCYKEDKTNDGNGIFYLEKVESFDCTAVGDCHITEKTLENVLVEIFRKNGTYMPIFQERAFQSEPDVVALDEQGNLLLFELKCVYIDKKTGLDDRLFRYVAKWKNFSYDELNQMYRKYKGASAELQDDHRKFFGVNLKKTEFNRTQKLICVANVISDDLIDYIVSLRRASNYTVDFIPYRFYKIGGELFFDFFTKPFDDDDVIVRLRHNLILKIAKAINDRMDEEYCTAHAIFKRHFGGNLLQRWNGESHGIMYLTYDGFDFNVETLYENFFLGLELDDKNFYMSFYFWDKDTTGSYVHISCNDIAKNISAFKNQKFKHEKDSKGREIFRYDLPISQEYSAVNFFKMDEAARSLFDEENFNAAIDYMMIQLEQFFTLLK